jgi:hypothetical protein
VDIAVAIIVAIRGEGCENCPEDCAGPLGCVPTISSFTAQEDEIDDPNYPNVDVNYGQNYTVSWITQFANSCTVKRGDDIWQAAIHLIAALRVQKMIKYLLHLIC